MEGIQYHASALLSYSKRLLLRIESFSVPSLSMMSSYSSVMENPNRLVLFYRPDKNGKTTDEVMLNLPHLGPVTLDVVLFSASAVLFRLYMMVVAYRERRRNARRDDDVRRNQRDYDKTGGVVKARIIGGYKDSGLYQTMKECEEVKLKLRKVADPDVARRDKQKQIKLRGIVDKGDGALTTKNASGDSGYLELSPAELQGVRKILKQVGRGGGTNGGDRNYGGDENVRPAQ